MAALRAVTGEGSVRTPDLGGSSTTAQFAAAVIKKLSASAFGLGEINDQQQAAGRKTLQVFDEDAQCYSLFPDDRQIPADALDSVQVRLSGLELRRPRMFGNCWLGCELWHQLGRDEFWQQRLPQGRQAVSWEKGCGGGW